MSTTVPQAHQFAPGLIVLAVQLCFSLSLDCGQVSITLLTIILKKITAKRLRGLAEYICV